ncbi:hypothetical protein L1987_09291 [Smallanthus sonchifolius]|uniref:Uncharacterized protein n=1 Tax=Smallanthus sonchifolius TaxID=185202 RepID=A0ACB9JNH9_9ASTR|nr:hypothetical protein L1987_09291 [Smallanthus sonchifolius]
MVAERSRSGCRRQFESRSEWIRLSGKPRRRQTEEGHHFSGHPSRVMLYQAATTAAPVNKLTVPPPGLVFQQSLTFSL